MTIIIASLALFFALIALWMAAANAKKIEAGNKELKSQINTDIDKVEKEILAQVDALEKKTGAFDGKMEGITESQAQARETASALEKEVAKVSQNLRNLTAGLPPQFPSKPRFLGKKRIQLRAPPSSPQGRCVFQGSSIHNLLANAHPRPKS